MWWKIFADIQVASCCSVSLLGVFLLDVLTPHNRAFRLVPPPPLLPQRSSEKNQEKIAQKFTFFTFPSFPPSRLSLVPPPLLPTLLKELEIDLIWHRTCNWINWSPFLKRAHSDQNRVRQTYSMLTLSWCPPSSSSPPPPAPSASSRTCSSPSYSHFWLTRPLFQGNCLCISTNSLNIFLSCHF